MKLNQLTTLCAFIAILNGLGLSPAQAQFSWTAYNNMGFNNNNDEYATNFRYGAEGNTLSSTPEHKSHLIAFEESLSSNEPVFLDIRVNRTITGGEGCYVPKDTGANVAPSTEAHDVFHGIVSLEGSWELRGENCEARLEFRKINGVRLADSIGMLSL